MINAYLMILAAFICGALPFSVWLTRIYSGEDVRQYGDGNPGAANVFRTGNKFLGLITLLLDVSKAAAPVGFAYNNLQIRGILMFLIAIAPVLGHMFSPFLAFKGGKAIATVLGVWIGLTLWKASLPAVIAAAIGSLFLTSSGWSVMLAMIAILVTLCSVDSKPAIFIYLGRFDFPSGVDTPRGPAQIPSSDGVG